MTVRLLAYGPTAVLAEVATAAEVDALRTWLADAPPPGVRTVVPAARTVLVETDVAHLSAVREHLERFTETSGAEAPRSAEDVLEIPVAYDGEDLEQVATACGMTIGDVVQRHAAPIYTAAFCGFSPGFAYLIGGDPSLQLPRRADPRTRVPAGSVAIAGEFSAVYPTPSPGGWHLLGRTSLDIWSVDRDPPGLIAPGTRVRFRPAPMP